MSLPSQPLFPLQIIVPVSFSRILPVETDVALATGAVQLQMVDAYGSLVTSADIGESTCSVSVLDVRNKAHRTPSMPCCSQYGLAERWAL
jgi:hypothetical protein